MTFLGKLFVMVNLVISLMMATVAMGLYSSSIDWTERAAKGGDPSTAGLAGQRKSQLKQDLEAAPAVEAGWRDSVKVLLDLEEKRQQLQKFYTAELVHTRSQATEADPARDVDLQDNGQPKADPDPKRAHLPLRIPAQDRQKNPLGSIALYESKLKKSQSENDALRVTLGKEFGADMDLVIKLTPPAGAKRGLRDLIAAERIKRLGILDEIEQVQHLGTKSVVEAAVVGERIEALDQQIQALRRTLSRLRGVDSKK